MSTNNAESIVTSLHWSKELQKAGWPRAAGVYFWHEAGSKLESGEGQPYSLRLVQPAVRSEDSTCLKDYEDDVSYSKYFAAPTAEEILRRLPRRLTVEGESDGKWICINSHADREGWKIGYLEHPYRFLAAENTLANAAAAMYCYLAENGLLPKA